MSVDTHAARRLRIWMVQIGEEMPFDPGPPRLLRAALLAAELTSRGHDVTFWNAGFNHQKKRLREATGTKFATPAGYRVCLLEGRPYRRNISLARVFSHRDNARSFAEMSRDETPPNVMTCGLPSLEIADAATRYARDHGVPIAVDCRDMWPDAIADALPAPARLAAFPILAYWRAMLRRIMGRATAIIGVSEGFLNWGLSASGRAPGADDRVFHLTLSQTEHDPAKVAQADGCWDGLLGDLPAGTKIGVYAGSLSRRYDLLTVARSLSELSAEEKARLRIVICGDGDVSEELARLAADEPSLIVPGWRSGAELYALLKRADFGIIAYPASPDFLITFPNKVGEYLSYGLPVVSGIDGVMGSMLGKLDLLLRYEAGDPKSAADLFRRILGGGTLIDDDQTARRARDAFHAYFDPEQIIPAFADYVEALATRRPADAQQRAAA
jgi:glycosyltransferase involved in cell wall biosynthesis